MGRGDKEREILVCQWLAAEMNRTGGSDYRVEPWNPDPPDVLFVSESGKYPAREVEVVSTPQDFTIRSDNQNLQSLERKLATELKARGIGGCHVDVAWAKEVVRYGVTNWHSMIIELANIIANRIQKFVSDGQHLRITKPELHDPTVHNAVDVVSIVRLPKPFLRVDSCAGLFIPSDARWIEEAIRKKSEKYDARAARDWILVIDGDYVDGEQIASFRAAHAPAQLPFAEIWAVTVFGIYRLKP